MISSVSPIDPDIAFTRSSGMVIGSEGCVSLYGRFIFTSNSTQFAIGSEYSVPPSYRNSVCKRYRSPAIR